MRFFETLVDQDEENQETRTFRLFNRNDHYTAHGRDARLLATSFLNTSQALTMMECDADSGLAPLDTLVISEARFEMLLHHLLVENNYSLQMYSLRNRDRWVLSEHVSPCSLGSLESKVFNLNAVLFNQVLLAFNVIEDKTYFASFDVLKCSIIVGVFNDESTRFHLESLLVQLAPKMCFYACNGQFDKRIDGMLRKNKVVRRSGDFDNHFSENDLDFFTNLLRPKFVNLKNELVKNCKYDNVWPTLSVLLNFLFPNYSKLDAIEVESSKESFSLDVFNVDAHVHLDISSLANLHLFPPPKETQLKSTSKKAVRSIYDLLNHCKTYSGRILLDKMIRTPEINHFVISEFP